MPNQFHVILLIKSWKKQTFEEHFLSFKTRVAIKSVTTKLTTAVGLWGSGQFSKKSPKSSPPSTPSSPEKSPSFKSRFFTNYMNNQKKENKGEQSSFSQ